MPNIIQIYTIYQLLKITLHPCWSITKLQWLQTNLFCQHYSSPEKDLKKRLNTMGVLLQTVDHPLKHSKSKSTDTNNHATQKSFGNIFAIGFRRMLIYYPLTCGDRMNSAQHSQCHDCCCPGSLHRQGPISLTTSHSYLKFDEKSFMLQLIS